MPHFNLELEMVGKEEELRGHQAYLDKFLEERTKGSKEIHAIQLHWKVNSWQ